MLLPLPLLPPLALLPLLRCRLYAHIASCRRSATALPAQPLLSLVSLPLPSLPLPPPLL